jgi:2-dehydro-3-deoxyphosphogluconate aldolase/(4S)-4-hydroxy-2-oxoglutarate aldolase
VDSDPLGKRFFKCLSDAPVLGVLRGCPTKHAVDVADAAFSAGVKLLEVTLDHGDALQQIELLSDGLPEVLVGAGTVRTSEQVDAAVEAGAQYLVAPSTRSDVLSRAALLGVPCIPGAATATEIEHAMELGATAVKVFPAEQLGGPAYLRALQVPLSGIPLLPSGGVDVTNATEYMSAGAAGLIVGSCVFSAGAMVAGDYTAISQATRELVEVMR